MGCDVYMPDPWADAQMLPLGRNRAVPARLVMAREVRGLSVLELAAKTDMNGKRLRDLEAGVAPATAQEVARLVMALNFPLAFFQQPIPLYEQQEGPTIFICGSSARATCARCERFGDVLCDYPMGNGETCDLPLCSGCAVTQMPSLNDADSIDYCPQHALMAEGLVIGPEMWASTPALESTP